VVVVAPYGGGLHCHELWDRKWEKGFLHAHLRQPLARKRASSRLQYRCVLRAQRARGIGACSHCTRAWGGRWRGGQRGGGGGEGKGEFTMGKTRSPVERARDSARGEGGRISTPVDEAAISDGDGGAEGSVCRDRVLHGKVEDAPCRRQRGRRCQRHLPDHRSPSWSHRSVTILPPTARYDQPKTGILTAKPRSPARKAASPSTPHHGD
jgi:hypothetical protein